MPLSPGSNLKNSNDIKIEYVKLIKIKKNQKTSVARCRLPFTVGSTADSDVIVNSPALAGASKFVFSAGGKLRVIDSKKMQVFPEESLLSLGLKVKGPYVNLKINHGRVGKVIAESLSDEARLFATLPNRYQNILGGSFTQFQRLSIWGSAFALFLCLMTASFNRIQDQSVVDMSHEAIPIVYAKVFKETLGAAGDYRSYIRGASFVVQIEKEAAESPHVFIFDLKGVSQFRDIEVYIGKTRIFELANNEACQFSYCKNVLLVDRKYLKVGPNTIEVRNTSGKDYLVRNILFEKCRKILQSELVAMTRRFESANRSFQERGIAHENIVRAKIELEKVIEFLQVREGADDLMAEAIALKGEVAEEMEKTIDRLWFSAKRDLQLAKYDTAKSRYQDLLGFYPDATTSQHAEIKETLTRIKELTD